MTKQQGNSFWGTIINFAILIIVLLIFARGVCCDEREAIRALKIRGYTKVELVEHKYVAVAFRGCGTDAARFDMKAINPAGEEVEVFICTGLWLKGATLRTE